MGTLRSSETAKDIDIRPLGRAAQRLFTATQWMFALTIVFGAVYLGIAAGLRESDAFVHGVLNWVLRVLMLGALIGYSVLFVIMDYRRRFALGALLAASSMFLGWTIAAVFVTREQYLEALADPAAASPFAQEGGYGEFILGLSALILFGPPLYWFGRQALGARLLLRAPALAREGRFIEEMEAAKRVAAAQIVAGHGARGRFWLLGRALTGIGFFGVVVTILGAIAAVSVDRDLGGSALAVAETGVSLLLIGFFLLPLCALLIALGRRLAQPESRRLLEADARAPVLLLRSFQDDSRAISGRNAFARFLFFGLYGRKRLETAIAPELARLGPFVAIGDPGETLPDLGAARAYLDDHAWRPQVLDWIGKARLIVMVGGATPSVGWEMEQIAALRKLDRLLFLLPPRRADSAAERAARLELMRASLNGSAWSAALDDLAARGALDEAIAVFQAPGGRLIALRNRRPRQADYEIAVRAAAVALLAQS